MLKLLAKQIIFSTQDLTMYFCKTFFSLKYGTFSTEELVQAGVEAAANSLALTNISSTCDAWDFVHVIYPLDRKAPADRYSIEVVKLEKLGIKKRTDKH